MLYLPPSSRVPPYSEEAERSLLGSILLDAVKVLDLCVEEGLSADAFYIPANRTVFEKILEMSKTGRAIDLSTVAEFCKSENVLEYIGGAIYLDRLVDGTPTSEHAQYYAQLVLQKQLLRSIIASARDVEASAYESGDDPEEIRSKAEYQFAQLQRTADEVQTPEVYVGRQLERWKLAQTSGCAGIRTGFSIVDDCFGGLMEACMLVVSGKPGSGKTTLVRNIVENVASRGTPVSYCSQEQTAEQLWGSIAARRAKQSVFLLNCGSKKVNFVPLQAAAEEVVKWPIYIDDRPKTPSQLWSFARREITKHGSKLIVLDYLQALKEERDYASMEEKVSSYSDTCRCIAKELRTRVIVVSSLSNQGNLRGSGQIAYDVWGHIMLAKAEDWSPKNLHYQASVEKQRFGPEFTGTDLWLIGDQQRFEDNEGMKAAEEYEKVIDRTQPEERDENAPAIFPPVAQQQVPEPTRPEEPDPF